MHQEINESVTKPKSFERRSVVDIFVNFPDGQYSRWNPRPVIKLMTYLTQDDLRCFSGASSFCPINAYAEINQTLINSTANH